MTYDGQRALKQSCYWCGGVILEGENAIREDAHDKCTQRENKQFLRSGAVDGLDWCDECEDMVSFRDVPHGVNEEDYVMTRYCWSCGNIIQDE